MKQRIDGSRYRVADAIVSRWRAGESIDDLAADYRMTAYQVELIVAAWEVGRGIHG